MRTGVCVCVYVCVYVCVCVYLCVLLCECMCVSFMCTVVLVCLCVALYFMLGLLARQTTHEWKVSGLNYTKVDFLPYARWV